MINIRAVSLMMYSAAILYGTKEEKQDADWKTKNYSQCIRDCTQRSLQKDCASPGKDAAEDSLA